MNVHRQKASAALQLSITPRNTGRVEELVHFCLEGTGTLTSNGQKPLKECIWYVVLTLSVSCIQLSPNCDFSNVFWSFSPSYEASKKPVYDGKRCYNEAVNFLYSQNTARSSAMMHTVSPPLKRFPLKLKTVHRNASPSGFSSNYYSGVCLVQGIRIKLI